MGSEFGVVGKGVFMDDVHNKEDDVSVDCALRGMVVKIGDVVTGVVNGVGGGILVGGGDVVAGVVGGVDVATGVVDDVAAIKVDEDILVVDVVCDVAGGFGDIVAGDTSRLKRTAAAGTKNVRKMTMNIVVVRETNGMVSAYSRL